MIRVQNAGSIGVVKDLSQHELPEAAWSDAMNIRFLDGYCWQFYGHDEVYIAPSTIPLHILPVSSSGVKYWFYAGQSSVFKTTIYGGVAVHTDMTRASGGPYAGSANGWTSTLLGGIPILNAGNTVDLPQYWDLNPANKLVSLPNWPSNTFCKALRSYKNYLIALNVTKAGANYRYMVKWSHPADPGAVPASWDHTDPTRDAGETDLAEGFDEIIDGLQLRDSFMIYKESSVWRMDYVGGPYVFRFQKVLGTSGALNRNCIVEVDGLHFVLTNSDVVVHDGSMATSILDKQTRRSFFQDIDVENISLCFVFKNPFFNEVYVCYPAVGSSVPNKAMVWNYKDKTVSFKSVPNIYHAASGPVDNSLTATWEQDGDPWAADLSTWDGGGLVPSTETARTLMAGTGPKLYLLDGSASFSGALPAAYLERRGLSFGKPESIKLCRGVRPRIVGNTGDTVRVSIGGQLDPWSEPEWGAFMDHVIGQTVADDCLVSGRYIAVRFETGTAYQWRLDSYDLDIEETGGW